MGHMVPGLRWAVSLPEATEVLVFAVTAGSAGGEPNARGAPAQARRGPSADGQRSVWTSRAARTADSRAPSIHAGL